MRNGALSDSSSLANKRCLRWLPAADGRNSPRDGVLTPEYVHHLTWYDLSETPGSCISMTSDVPHDSRPESDPRLVPIWQLRLEAGCWLRHSLSALTCVRSPSKAPRGMVPANPDETRKRGIQYTLLLHQRAQMVRIKRDFKLNDWLAKLVLTLTDRCNGFQFPCQCDRGLHTHTSFTACSGRAEMIPTLPESDWNRPSGLFRIFPLVTNIATLSSRWCGAWKCARHAVVQPWTEQKA